VEVFQHTRAGTIVIACSIYPSSGCAVTGSSQLRVEGSKIVEDICTFELQIILGDRFVRIVAKRQIPRKVRTDL